MSTIQIIWQICNKLSLILLVCSFILSLRFYRKLGSELKFFFLFILLGISTEAFSFIYINILEQKNNLFVIPLYYNFEFFIMTCLFFKYFYNKINWISIGIAILIQLFLCIEGYRSIFHEQIYSFHAYGKVLVNFVIIIYSLKFFLNLAKGKSPNGVSKVALNSLFFIYYVLSLILFIFINFLINGDTTITIYFWIFYSFLTALYYLSISLLIWKVGTTHKLSLFGYQSF